MTSPRLCVACRSPGCITTSKLCWLCREEGLRWCWYRQHVVPVAAYGDNLCRSCGTDRMRRSRGLLPPPGYVRAQVLAQQLGYTPDYLVRCMRRGWMRGKTWQRCPKSDWYVRDLPTYPPLTTREGGY